MRITTEALAKAPVRAYTYTNARGQPVYVSPHERRDLARPTAHLAREAPTHDPAVHPGTEATPAGEQHLLPGFGGRQAADWTTRRNLTEAGDLAPPARARIDAFWREHRWETSARLRSRFRSLALETIPEELRRKIEREVFRDLNRSFWAAHERPLDAPPRYHEEAAPAPTGTLSLWDVPEVVLAKAVEGAIRETEFGRSKTEFGERGLTRLPEFLHEPLAKAVATETGDRWITVHPNGNEAEGVPVLLRASRSEPGVFHVVGGAGGSMNGLRIGQDRLRTPEQYEAARKERVRRRKDELARKRAAETTEETEDRARSRVAVDLEARDAERALLKEWAETLGVDLAAVDVDRGRLEEANLSKGAHNLVLADQHRALVTRMKETLEEVAREVVLDHEGRAEILGELPFVAAPDTADQIALTDLVDADPTGGLGYRPAEPRRELEEGEAEQTGREVREERLSRIEQEEGPERRAEIEHHIAMRRATREEATRARERIAPTREDVEAKTQRPADLTATQKARLLKMRLELQRIQRARATARRDVAVAETAPKVFDISIREHVDPVSAEQVRASVEEDIRTQAVRSLLGEIDDRTRERALLSDPRAEYRRDDYVGAIARGAHAALEEASLGAVSTVLLDRDVADVLGPAASAQVVARHLRATLGDEKAGELADQVAAYHRATQGPMIEEAQRRAAKALDEARELGEFGQIGTVTDMVRAQEANRRRIALIGEAREALGSALGRLEATAALHTALRGKVPETLQIPLGVMAPERAAAVLAGIGLAGDDHRLFTDGKNQVVELSGDAMGKLVHPIDAREVESVHRLRDIMGGKHDEAGWKPAGFADRPMSTFEDPRETLTALRRPLQIRPGMSDEETGQAVRDYVGGRLADGHTSQSVLDDMLASDWIDANVPAGERDQYERARNGVFPLDDLTSETHQERLRGIADEAIARRGITDRALHSQEIPLGDATYEALHRSLAQYPRGVAAFTPIGKLSAQEKAVLRAEFWDRHAQLAPGERARIEEQKRTAAKEPPRQVGVQTDMWGTETPIYDRQIVDESGLRHGDLDKWETYVKVMGGTDRAYQALQDHVRGQLLGHYQREHGRAYGTPLRTGHERIRHADRHLVGSRPPEQVLDILRRERDAKATQYAGLRKREAGGRFAAGEVKELAETLRKKRQAEQQFGLFAASVEDQPVVDERIDRTTIGKRAEAQLASVMPYVARGFDPERPVAIPRAMSMDGKYVGQQRAIKALEERKRLVLAYGVGSGKSPIMIGAFTHLHSQGKVKRALIAAPSAVQGQLGGEFLKFTKPGAYRWHASPGASREERLAAYRDDSGHHAVVVTHQALRDDAIHLLASQHGVTEDAAVTMLREADAPTRAKLVREAFARHGATFDFMAVDEGHNALNRQGKAESQLAMVVDAISRDTPYFVSATADPIKNDPSEGIDHLRKVAPAKYEGHEAEFMRRYGQKTSTAAEGLQREWSAHAIAEHIRSGATVTAREERVPLHPEQDAEAAEIHRLADQVRLGVARGTVDVEALKKLSPKSFADRPAADHESIAANLASAIGTTRDGALKRVIDAHPSRNAKVDRIRELVRERRARGEPGVVFAHSRAAVRHITEALRADGHRVTSFTGEDSGADKERKRLAFHPPSGREEDAKADVLVASDAGAVGLNLQRGRWLIQHDTPDTPMVHDQRQGRINRLGQQNPVELIDLVADHPLEERARARLADKRGVSEVFQAPSLGLDDTGLAGWITRARAGERDDVHPLNREVA